MNKWGEKHLNHFLWGEKWEKRESEWWNDLINNQILNLISFSQLAYLKKNTKFIKNIFLLLNAFLIWTNTTQHNTVKVPGSWPRDERAWQKLLRWNPSFQWHTRLALLHSTWHHLSSTAPKAPLPKVCFGLVLQIKITNYVRFKMQIPVKPGLIMWGTPT